MTEREFIGFLYAHGHFWSPEDPDSWNVAPEDLDTLTLVDRVVKGAVRSYQQADANLVPVARQLHGRDPVADGDPGPATFHVATLPRCPMPDHPPPPGVQFQVPLTHDGQPDLYVEGAIRSMQQFAVAGSGGWPASGCDPQRMGIHSMRVSIDTSRCPAKVKAYLAEALAAVSKCYADIGLSVRYVEGGAAAELVKHFENIPGNVIGVTYFPQPNRCSRITGKLDSTFVPDMPTWANLETHETGHGVGLQHTRGGIMNPSLIRVWPLTWRGSPSLPALQHLYGGSPLPDDNIHDNLLL
jgi:hypothetical protein